ncbi:Ribonuclease Oy [Anthophora plagiata]
MFNCKITIRMLLFLVIANVNGEEDYSRRGSGSTDFDVLIFTQSWPKTVCFTWKESSASHTCTLPKDQNEWTIHGIWPSQYHKMGPQFCDKSKPFDAKALKDLQSELQEKWIDVEYGKESYSFWEHEWNKHGTCAAQLRQLDTEVKYFGEGLHLLGIYDMKNVLAKASILPGQIHNATTILNAVERVLGKRSVLICRENHKTGELYILEIRICFDKTLGLINCDGVYGYPTNCNSYKDVIYPGEVPHLYNVVQV